jgi:pyridoxine kinase
MRVVLVTATQAQSITHPRIDAAPKGTGDLFCAALTGHWLQGLALPEAAARACDHVVRALQRTRQAHSAELLLPTP